MSLGQDQLQETVVTVVSISRITDDHDDGDDVNDDGDEMNIYGQKCIKRNTVYCTCNTVGLKFYRVMVVPVLSYGCQLWTATKKLESKIQASETACLRGVNRCSKLERIRNFAVRQKLQVFNLNEKVKHYKQRRK